MTDIKLFVCCHQPVDVPKHPLLFPIQVGAALSTVRFPDFLQDDIGYNISKKNRSYCELTAQYWAWKNIDADYYGFFHYRRYLYPDLNAKRPYRIEHKPSISLLDKLGYSEFEKLILQYDMILPKGEDMYLAVDEHYSTAPFHHQEDLELTKQIIRRIYPELVPAMDEYLSGTICYFGNIFIMRKQIFQDYCSWLFTILEEFDALSNTVRYTRQEQRVDGYLGERLLGIYYTGHKNEWRSLELPRVHIEPAGTGTTLEKQILYYLFPPESKHRAALKRIAGKMRKGL